MAIRTIHHQGEIPLSEKIQGICSIAFVFICYSVPWFLTFILGPLVILTSEKTTNIFGETSQPHSDKYIERGSSGFWHYVATKVKWLAPWNNLEDGLNGEPSGKHSATVKGKETSFINRYRWLMRNPFNQGKRLSRFFSCYVDDCTIEYWGNKTLSDKNDLDTGYHWVKATDAFTGKVYYGYRRVHDNRIVEGRPFLAKVGIPLAERIAKLFNKDVDLTNTVYNSVFGFKLRPTHGEEVQDLDDKDKAFTARVQIASKIN